MLPPRNFFSIFHLYLQSRYQSYTTFIVYKESKQFFSMKRERSITRTYLCPPMIQPLGVRQVHPPISNRQIISHINVEMVNLCKAINDNFGPRLPDRYFIFISLTAVHIYDFHIFTVKDVLFVNLIQIFLDHCYFRSLLSCLFS